MPNSTELEEKIAEVLQEQFLVRSASPEDDLVDSGVVDSLTLIQLLVQLEQQFAVTIPLTEIEIEDIRSVRSLARLIATRRMTLAAGVRG